jgi:2-oxoglutarate ferredoxin oxidoreductase subunit alpha
MVAVRGGHNFYQIRLSDLPVSAPRDEVDIIVALDRESIMLHEAELRGNGRIIGDLATLKLKPEKKQFIDIPFADLATRSGGSAIMANTVATGAVLGILGMELTRLFEIITDTFNKKGEAVIEANRNAALAGYDFALKPCSLSFSVTPGAIRNCISVSPLLSARSSRAVNSAAYPAPDGDRELPGIKEVRHCGGAGRRRIAAINMALSASLPACGP